MDFKEISVKLGKEEKIGYLMTTHSFNLLEAVYHWSVYFGTKTSFSVTTTIGGDQNYRVVSQKMKGGLNDLPENFKAFKDSHKLATLLEAFWRADRTKGLTLSNTKPKFIDVPCQDNTPRKTMF